MERLTSSLLWLHSRADDPRPGERIAEAVARAIDCDLAACIVIDPMLRGGKVELWPRGLRPAPMTVARIERHRRSHPLVRRLAEDRAVRAWRFVDVAADAGASLDDDAYCALPVRFQMVMRLASPDGRVHGVALARNRAEFDDGEWRRLELMWLELVRLLRHARRAAQHGRGAPSSIERPRAERGIVVLDAGLHVLLATEQARLWLNEYFAGSTARHAPSLPGPVLDWVRQRPEASSSACASRSSIGRRWSAVATSAIWSSISSSTTVAACTC